MSDLVRFSSSSGLSRQTRREIAVVREEAIIADERIAAASWVAFTAHNHARGLAAQELYMVQRFPHAAHRAYEINEAFAQVAVDQVRGLARPRCSGR